MFFKRIRLTAIRICWMITIAICIIYYGKYGKEGYNFYGDALGYYMYLPSSFIYHNHKSIETLPKDRGIRPFIHGYAAQMGGGHRGPKGYVLNQYTYGIALMELPFFLAAHAWEKMSGGLANGFSASYRLAIDLSSLVYALLGLWVLFKVLRRRYSDTVAHYSIILILIGSNLFWFVFQQQGMAHVPLFFLFTLLLYVTEKIYAEGKPIQFVWLGLIAGLITIIRPIDGLCLLIPLLYHSGSPYLRTKFEFIIQYWRPILLASCCFLIPIIPQLLYWKWLTGYSVYDSYGPDQKFSFLHPHIISGLFGASNGWLFYTPLMLFALIGFLFINKWREYAPGTILFLVGYIWCVYSWFLPNYINGLGSRPMVDVYPILALPLAAFIDWLGNRGPVIRTTGIVLMVASVLVNLNYSLKKVIGLLNTDDSKYAFNLNTFFRFHLIYNDLIAWDIGISQPDERTLVRGTQLCISLADSTYSEHIIADSLNRSKVFTIKEGEEYSPLFVKMEAKQLLSENVHWLQCSGRFRILKPVNDIYKNQLLVLQIRSGEQVKEWYGVRINNKVGLLEPGNKLETSLGQYHDNIWGTVRFYVPIPKNLSDNDEIRLDVWNIGKTSINVSELCLSTYR